MLSYDTNMLPLLAQRRVIAVSAIHVNSCTTEEHVSLRILYDYGWLADCGRKDLAGWQLDKLAEDAKRQPGDKSDSDSDSDDDLPFACLICRKPFTDPVVTRCGHYYCSSCAIKRFAKTPKCLACGTPTGGLFNRAEKVIAKMKEKEKEQENEKEDANESGVSGVQVEGLKETGASGDEGSESEDD